jgi:eukaryotic-like serine/threonine-protein kinase
MARLPQPTDVIAGKYMVERVLGQGGMGIVYVVTHCVTGKRLALKCLLPEFLHNPDLVERFVREAQATGRIQNRHVVDVFDVGRDGDVLFIVMELLDGKPLTELLRDERLTLEEALAILVRAMEGVAAAHAHGIVHRDLKPDNIFVCLGASGRLDDPRVLDFGISKVDDGAGSSLTRSGVAMGTPYYMALEQLSGARDIDVRVDVYAMGVILYEAIAGVPPHVADSVAALAIRLLTTEPTHLRDLRPDLPAGLADVIMKALARERDQRHPSMQALIDAVRPFVPRGASLLVPEGQGRLLRTPRSTPGRVRSGVTSAAPAVPAQLMSRPGTPSGVAPASGSQALGAVSTASTTPMAVASPAAAATGASRTSKPIWVAGAAVALALGAGVIWWAGKGAERVVGVSAPPSGVPSLPVSPQPPSAPQPGAIATGGEPARPPSVPPSVPLAVAPSPQNDAAGAAPVDLPEGPTSPQAALPDADAGAENHTGKQRGKRPRPGPVAGAPASPAGGADATGRAPTGRAGVTVTGRAGTLGSDDF